MHHAILEKAVGTEARGPRHMCTNICVNDVVCMRMCMCMSMCMSMYTRDDMIEYDSKSPMTSAHYARSVLVIQNHEHCHLHKATTH
jgi:hypothetical protein